MARIKNGILGGISGKIGDAEGYVRNGIAYIRAKKHKNKKAPSVKQLVARQKWLWSINFTAILHPLKLQTTAFNAWRIKF